MPLTFNLRHLENKNLHLTGELPPEDLDAEGLNNLIQLRQPLKYDLWLERLGHNILVQGRLSAVIDCECARCLKPFQKKLEFNDWAVDLPLEGEDKVAVDNDLVDLTPWIREDTLLAFPQHPLCEKDCRGLPQTPRLSSQHGHDANQPLEAPSVWAELNKLKF